MNIRIVVCISVVSVTLILLAFLVIQQWAMGGIVSVGENSWVQVILAVGAMLAAVFSACAAFAANSIAQQSKKLSESIAYDEKIRRTLSMSRYESELVLKSFRYLEKSICENRDSKPLSVKDAEVYFDGANGSDLEMEFRMVLNYWGRIASAYKVNILDEKLATKMFKHGFSHFFKVFGEYFDKKFLPDVYQDTNELREIWKCKNCTSPAIAPGSNG